MTTCRECGQQISDTASVCPHCGAPVVKDVYCIHCGEKMSADSRFCPNCGTINRQAARPDTGKDRLLTGLLAIFLGTLGIHYFYIGKNTAGVICILLCLCTCGIWSVITFIQGIVILTLSDDEFDDKFVNNDKKFPIF